MTAEARLRRRGEPLIALCLLIAGWVGLRAAMWEAGRAAVPQHAGSSDTFAASGSGSRRAPAAISQQPVAPAPQASHPRPWAAALPPASPAPARAGTGQWRKAAGYRAERMTAPDPLAPPDASRPAARSAAPAPPPLAATRTARWSADGWLLLRTGGGGAGLAAGAAAYGGSQAGAVVRYRLGGASRAAPYLYARVAGAIDMPGDRPEAALGLGLRPVGRAPVRVLGEVRVRDGGAGGGLDVRPAVLAVSEVPPARLPARFEGELYAQAGYVGGRDATGFFDLQAVADRALVRPANDAELRLGGGLWAGGQRGAGRLDLGPRLSLRMKLGDANARLAADWRVRVAGNAAPGSGAALTLSTGF